MKLKHRKKLIILLPLLLIILLAFGTFKNYQSFRHDQYQTAMDMDSMMRLFNMQLQVPDNKKSSDWIYLQPFQLPDYNSFDMKIFTNYMIKNVTFQEITYKDIEPQWSLLPTQVDSKFPNTKSTTECLKNFNENLLYNPEYEQYRRDAEFDKPLTMEDLLNDPKKVVNLKEYLINNMHGISLRSLVNNSCPSQYLPNK